MTEPTLVSNVVRSTPGPAAGSTSMAGEAPASAPEIRRVRFVAEAPAGEPALLSFREPGRRVAICDHVDRDALSRDDAGTPAGSDTLDVCLLPNGPGVSIEEQRRMDEWVAAGGVPVAELLVRGDKIRWRPGRCTIQASSDRWAELLLAVVTFSFHEGELRKLETELEGALQAADQDTDLVGPIDGRALPRWDRVRTLAQEATRRRLRFAGVEPHLERAPVTLPAAAQRAVNELAMQADVAARLVNVDDRIEVLESLYTTASERLSEYSYFRREHVLEIAILGVLVLEMVLLLADLLSR